MVKSFVDVVLESVEPITLLAEPPFGFKLREQWVPAYSRLCDSSVVRSPEASARPEARAPSGDFLALPVSFSPGTSIEIFGPHHMCDKGLDVLLTLLGLEHERNHHVGGELSAHHSTRGLSFHAPLVAGEECVLRIVHRGTAVVTRLFVFYIKALQILVETTVTRQRLRQVEANLTVLLLQPGREIWD